MKRANLPSSIGPLLYRLEARSDRSPLSNDNNLSGTPSWPESTNNSLIGNRPMSVGGPPQKAHQAKRMLPRFLGTVFSDRLSTERSAVSPEKEHARPIQW